MAAESCDQQEVKPLRGAGATRSWNCTHDAIRVWRGCDIGTIFLRARAPERWYPRATDGLLRKFDDLPRQYAGNVNTEPPFDRQPGDRPALSRSERADIVAFLRTLTDGFQGGAAKSTAASITGDRGMPTEQRVR